MEFRTRTAFDANAEVGTMRQNASSDNFGGLGHRPVVAQMADLDHSAISTFQVSRLSHVKNASTLPPVAASVSDLRLASFP